MLIDAYLGVMAAPEPSVRTQQALYLATVAVLPLLAAAPRVRDRIAAQPRRFVVALLLLDFVYMLWLTIPFVPLGVDETFYAINAHVYGGNHELWHCWTRPPMASFGAMLCPWHPPLIGLLCRALAAWFAWLLAERAVRAPWSLAAPLLVLVSSQLSVFSAALMSEPYGAVCVAAFALIAVRGVGGGAGAGALAGLAFLSRWPLGWLLPVALFVGYRQRRLRGLLLAFVAFAVPVAAVIFATDTKPWAMAADRGEWRQSVSATLLYFLRPDVAYGVGWSHLILLLFGALHARDAAVRWCLFLFAACAVIVTITGEATMRFMTPMVPVVAVVVARGMQHVAEWISARRPLPPLLGGPFVALVAMSVAFPVRPLRNHAHAAIALQNVVRLHRDELLGLLGDAPLYTDCNFIAVTAVLNHRCHAVPAPPGIVDDSTPIRRHPAGVGLDLDGFTPSCPRERLPAGAFYLTFDPGGREVLWQAEDLFLVRW